LPLVFEAVDMDSRFWFVALIEQRDVIRATVSFH
jgi:hypothetical protein